MSVSKRRWRERGRGETETEITPRANDHLEKQREKQMKILLKANIKLRKISRALHLCYPQSIFTTFTPE